MYVANVKANIQLLNLYKDFYLSWSREAIFRDLVSQIHNTLGVRAKCLACNTVKTSKLSIAVNYDQYQCIHPIGGHKMLCCLVGICSSR